MPLRDNAGSGRLKSLGKGGEKCKADKVRTQALENRREIQ
jgi:hypothetical protein